MSTAALLAEWHGAVDTGEDTPQLRRNLIREEAAEVDDAIQKGDRAHIAKECGDLIYVTYGTAYRYKFDLDLVTTAIHESNMSKIIGGVLKRADGKVLKGPHYFEPDIEAVLRASDARTEFLWKMSRLGGVE